jgi:hypothetical protein
MLVDIIFDTDRLEEEEIQKSTIPIAVGKNHI